jgi:hypothetical protein
MRLLLAGTAVSLALVPGSAWAALERDPQILESESGGALAVPLIHGPGGGALAPEGADPDKARAAQADEAPQSVGGQQPTPTAPEGRPQPGTESKAKAEPPRGVEDASSMDAKASRDVAGSAAESDGGDPLPTTGLGLIALAAVGLGFVLAGLALRR